MNEYFDIYGRPVKDDEEIEELQEKDSVNLDDWANNESPSDPAVIGTNYQTSKVYHTLAMEKWAEKQAAIEPIDDIALNKEGNPLDIGELSFRGTMGNIKNTCFNTLHGINPLQNGIPASKNTDSQGLVFFTRPCMNLTYDNISKSRKLNNLLTSDPTTVSFGIRQLLDPRRGGTYHHNGQVAESDEIAEGQTKTVIDANSPFIHIFSNLLTNLTGWPDESLGMYISEPGLKNEVTAQVDHLGNQYGQFQLTANFRNVIGDPISAILTAWFEYAKNVSKGKMVPYMEMISRRELDYFTRIYRLILDPTKRYIQKMACTGVAIPTANPTGASFQYSSDSASLTENNEISVPFTCIGYDYNDPIIVRDFNRTVRMFNNEMSGDYLTTEMVKIEIENIPEFNFQAYPLINHDMELLWYVRKESLKTKFI